MIFINRQVNNHYSMVGTHFLQTGYLLLNRNAPFDIWFLLEIILPGQSIISKSEQQKSNQYYSIAMLLLLRDYTFPKIC